MFGFSSKIIRHFQPIISELCHYEIPCIPVHIEEHSIPKMLIYHELAKPACPISSQVTDHGSELCNRTGEVHPVDQFHSLDNLKNHFASVTFCRNSGVYNVQNGAVIELSFVISVKESPRH